MFILFLLLATYTVYKKINKFKRLKDNYVICIIKMQMFTRHGKRWSVSELLSLQREYELLEWSVDQIALKHQRTVNSILFKLQDEGLINNWNEARGFIDCATPTWKTNDSITDDLSEYEDKNEEIDDVNDEDYVYEESCSDESDMDEESNEESSQVTKLAERVWSLESSVNDISAMVKHIFDSLVSKKHSLSSFQ